MMQADGITDTPNNMTPDNRARIDSATVNSLNDLPISIKPITPRPTTPVTDNDDITYLFDLPPTVLKNRIGERLLPKVEALKPVLPEKSLACFLK